MIKEHHLCEYLRQPTHPITISVIGCGGTGSYVVTQLAKINQALYHLTGDQLDVTVYDDDIVESHNVGRQLFSDSDIGHLKSDVIVSRVNRFYGLDWKSINQKLDWCPETNIVITCTDNVASRKMITKAKFKKHHREYQERFYWLDFGNSKDSGQVILSTFKHNDHFSELENIFDIFGKLVKDKPKEPSCSMAESLQQQDLFINLIMATTGINLLWKLLRDHKISYQGQFINLDTGNTRPLKIK